MDPKSLELVVVDSDTCCGTERCQHTSVRHRNHTGWLVDGKLRCRTSETAPFFECCLGLDEGLQCQFVAGLEGHTHGPQCGHELVPHGDHYDYIVGSRLHHVVGPSSRCCPRGCLGEVVKSTVVDHGHISVRNRAASSQAFTETVPLFVLFSLTLFQAPLVEEVVNTDIYVAGICCQSELPLIQSILEKLPGVESIEMTFVTKSIHVKHDAQRTSPAVLLSALNGAGLQASLGKREANEAKFYDVNFVMEWQRKAVLFWQKVAGWILLPAWRIQSPGSSFVTDHTFLCFLDSGLRSFPFHVFLCGVLLAVSLGSLISSKIEWLKFIALGAVLVGSPQIVLRGLASLRRRLLDINILMIAACVGAIALEEYHEAGTIIFLFGFAQWLENQCLDKASKAITSLHELQPEFAILAQTNDQIPVDQIAVDDVLVIRPGDRVAVDGIIIAGVSSLDESMLTGESRPVTKTVDDTVFSGSVNCGNGSLKVKSTSTMDGSTVALLSKKVQEASITKSKTDRIIESFAKYYTPTVVLLAIIFAILPLIVEALDLEDWLLLALILLVSACPCALVISTPVATICGVSTAARQSILIKGGQALEMLSKLKGVSFDKTGTLTGGHFTVVSITKLGAKDEDEILSLAAELEGHSSHPLAAAIVGTAAARKLDYSKNTEHVINVPGGGLIVRMDEIKTAAIGNLQLLVDHGFVAKNLEELRRLEDSLGKQGKKGCFVGKDGVIKGLVILADTIRDNAASALRTLTSMKLKLALLTGDECSAARHVAYSVGISPEHVYSRLLPEEKATTLQNLRTSVGSIGHVGDGVNDSIALAASDVGIAMGIGGSSMAIDAADVALFSNDLSSIPKAISISQKVRRVIYQNMVFSISIKLAVVVFAVFGMVHLWVAVAADVGSSLLVILNSLRILNRVPNKDRASCCQRETCSAQPKDVEMQRPGCCRNDHCHSTNKE